MSVRGSTGVSARKLRKPIRAFGPLRNDQQGRH
jgi:hypothetical protein